MKKGFTPYPMQGYWGKQFGLFLPAIATLFILVFSLTDYKVFKTIDNWQHIMLSLSLLSIGLFNMMMSKEKLEDERVKKIRAKSMQMFISAILIPNISFSFIMAFDEDFGGVGLFHGTIPFALLLYNIYFNYSLRFDPQWNYNEGGATDNFKSDKSSIIILTILFFAAIIIYSIL
ncbi:hypothetical protein OAQ99_05365 [Candidatus Kapabacteria bacterium]|nr:hypothetical protein [Candidatus Kapabacteria bacterium]